MGLNTFATGLAGLNSNSMGLNVVGNNLANLNTVGFKESNISFSDVLGQAFSTPGGGRGQVGLGSQVSGVQAVFSQGGVQTSNNPLDVAIQGKGFLVVKDNGSQYYTRAGNMHLDAQGNLVSASGMNVQGYGRNPVTGAVDSSLGIHNVQVPNGLMPPVATTQFELGMNLDASAPTGTNFSTNVQLYDSQGTAHIATLTMQKEVSTGATPVTKWRFDLTIPNNEVAGVASTNTAQRSLITGAVATNPPAAGALVVDNNGNLTSAYLGADPTTNPALANLTVPPGTVTLPQLSNGATFSPIQWKLIGDSGAPDVTAFSSTSEVTSNIQNGAAAGSISSVALQSDGTLSAVFSNGRTMDVGQIVLASFSNLNGLESQGGGLFTESNASGEAAIGAPGDNGKGELMSGALEQSNVDLAAELTKIITFQRGYQANARIITTTDQILQETLGLKQ